MNINKVQNNMNFKRVLFVIMALSLFTSCADESASKFPLQKGLYTCDVKDGILCINILDNLQCDIFFEGYEDYNRWQTFHGSINYEGGGVGSIFSIKGYAHKPYDDEKSIDPSSTFYGWQYIYTFTGSVGAIISETSFQYFIKTQRPFDNDNTINVVFTKR